MSNNRDDFTKKTIDLMAKRVGYRCSNPHCRKLTCGAAEEPEEYVNIGVAAHIRAAAPGGKRYDRSMTTDQRKSILNGIWLCQTCAKLVDSDEKRYTVEVLHEWKYDAETEAARQLEHENDAPNAVREMPYVRTLNQELGELLTMMETIHQKLDASKQDENVFMEQAYEKRLNSLMMLYMKLDAQLREKVSGSSIKHGTVCETVRPKRKGKKRGRGIMWIISAGTIAGILRISIQNVFDALALLTGLAILAWGIRKFFHDKPDFCQARIDDIVIENMLALEKFSVQEIQVMQAKFSVQEIQVMREMLRLLESEVEELHMDRIAYERELVESNEMAVSKKT